MRTVVVVVVVVYKRLRFHSFTFAKVFARTERERERERARRGSVSVSLPNAVPRATRATRSGKREREREREREKEIAQCKCIISNDYLVVVLVADDRSQSRDVAQSQDDKEAETITTIPRRRPHRPPPRCFGAGLLHNNREGERQREICVSRSNKTSFGSLSPRRV